MYRGIRRLVLAGVLAAGAPAALAQQHSLGISETDSAASFSRQNGRRLSFVCPAIATPRPEVWGTDVYASESAICTAAIHAGVLPMGQAGIVSIVMGEGGPFVGSGRNAVKTLDYGTPGFSYTFDRSTDPAAIDWSTNALQIPPGFERPVTVICPQGQKSDAFIWGTDIYITDSSICNAAVHAGVITTPEGGAVMVTKVPGTEAYTATTRNGMSSIAWSAWPDAFQLSRGNEGAGGADASSGRIIRTAGFAGAGNATDVVPRTIRLTGFSGSGTATDIVPRTIRTGGWTGTGPAP